MPVNDVFEALMSNPLLNPAGLAINANEGEIYNITAPNQLKFPQVIANPLLHSHSLVEVYNNVKKVELNKIGFRKE